MRTKISNSLKSKQNQFVLRMIVLVALFFSVGVQSVYASRYGRGIAYLKDGCPTGSGKVYVSVASSSSSSNSGWKDCTASGTSAQLKGAKTAMTFTFQAQANSGYRFTGWYTKNADETYSLITQETTYAVSKTTGSDPSNYSDAYTDVVCHAEFIKIVHYSFIVPEHGSYTITNNGVEVENYATIEAEGVVHLVSSPADGYRFAGWYTTTDGGVTKNYFSFDPETDLSFSDDATIGVDFRLDNGNALFYVVNGGMHDNLTTAITEASSISPKVVTVAQDGRLASGTYTIPAAVSFLVQHNKTYTIQAKAELAKAESKTMAYRRLTMAEGANIICNGKICVAGKQLCAGGGKASGYTTGACGVIDMSSGGYIQVNSGGKLYCWGFIKGQDITQGNNTMGVGTVVAKSGAEVWENFAVGDWRGGTACSSIQGSNFFPFQSYFIQNIEVPLTVEYGATNKCYASVNANSTDFQLPAVMIGTTDALFKLASGGEVRKWYDATTDLMCFELSGTANLDAVVVKDLPVIGDISSADYYLPISSNMHIILTNSNVTISKPMTVQPGAKIEVKSDANITISSNVFLYDKEEWGPYAGPDYYFHNYGNTYGILSLHKNRGNGKSKELLDDAQIIVDGQLNVTGKLYSTASGADVMGNGGGHVVFSALPSSSTTIDAFTGNGDAVSGGVTVNTANLHNEDESYTKAIASTTFYNVHGRWFKSGNQNENADHTYNFTYVASGAVSGTGGTDVSPNTHNAVYAPDKTGLTAGMKWCNVTQDGACSNIFNATQALNETPASDIRYTYPSSEWLQLLRTETEGVYGGSDNSLYAVEGCAVNSLGSVDENCLYTINEVKKALVDGHFVALEKNTEDEAWHDVANPTNYYISFEGCTWHPATKYAGEEKAYIVEDDIYIWYNNDWLLVEREDPYFFDYNDQNVKRYYEYENGAWVLATPCVSVTDVLETRYFYFWPEAFAIANSKKNATITLLKNVSSATSPLSFTAKNTTCTLDLNGHTASLTITASGNSANLFAINAANSTFTITDNSANQDGVLDITTSLKVSSNSYHTRGIAIVDGALILDAGTVRLSNTYPYTSTSNSGMIKGINVAAGKSFTMNGGAVYAESPYYPRAINVEGSASANATVNINNGTITAHSTTTTNAMGIYTIGGTLNVKPGVTINATTTTTSAYGIYVDASTNGYFGTLNMTGGKVNATGGTGSAYGIFVSGVYVSNNTTPNTFGANYKAKATIAGGTFNVTTASNTVAYGVCSRGTTTISGGDFTVAPATTTAIGVFAQDGTTTIEGNPTFDVSATEIAYGIQAGNTPNEKTGQSYNGNVIVKGGTFDVQTRSKTTAFGVYVYAGTRNITSTSSGYYPGHYVSAGKATIEGGTFNVTSKTTTAYGVHVIRATPLYDGEGNIDAYAQGEAIIKGGRFTVVGTTTASKTPTTDAIRAYGDVTITGGEFEVTAPGGYVAGLRIFDGKTTISGNPTFTVRGSTYAYGAFVTGVAPTSLGFISNAELEINNGSFDVATTGTTYAYGVLVSPVAPVATEDPEVFYKSPSTLTINDGHFTVKAQTTTAQGVNCSRGYLMAGTLPNTLLAENLGTAHINGGTFDVSTLGTTTAQGVTNSGNMTIGNATFNVTPKSTTAYGARCYHGLLTINEGSEFNVTATATAYGVVAGNEQPTTGGVLYDAEVVINGGTINVKTTSKATIYGLWASRNSRTIATGTANEGNYASAGKITVNGGEINVTAKTNPAYAVLVDAVVTQTGNADYPAATATPQAFINGGKFFVTATSSKNYAVSATPLAENCQITGGYYNVNRTQTSGTTLAKYAVSPKKVLTLRESHTLYPDGYRYTINEGGTVTWKNGTTTLKTEMYESGETPSYTGDTPTKAEDASYTYTHNGWDPAIAAMANADQTYTATFNHIEKKYTVNVAAGANGSASPASVSGIGCVTASGNITATPNTGYRFANWTLPTGVTAADGYTSESNPIHIHATASDKTITANFAAKTYTVTLNNQSATTAGAASVTATYNEAMPSIAANLPARTGYAFGGYFSETNGGGTQYYNADGTSAHIWDIDGETTLYAKWTINTHKLAWNFAGGSTTSSTYTEGNDAIVYGASITYPANNTMTKTGYTFASWDKSNTTMPDEDLTITASWTPNTNTAYTVNHYQQNIDNDNYTLYETDNLTGTTDASVTPAVKNYTGFTAPATQTVTILADGSQVVNYYYDRQTFAIRFVNGETELQNTNWRYGATPSYSGDEPTGAATAQYTYAFNGWSPSIVAVTEAKTYTAQFSSTVNNYTLTIGVNDAGYGSVDETSVTVPYGTSVSTSGNVLTIGSTTITATPTANTAEYIYAFSEWLNVPETVEGNVDNIQAVFTRTLNTVTVTWKNGDEVIETDEGVVIGATPTFDGETPTKETDATYGYTFDGWDDGTTVYAADALPTVSGAVTYTAHYSTTPTVASVTVSGATTYYTTIDDAFEYVNTVSANMTITLLADATAAASLVYKPKSTYTCTLNLNNHTISGSVAKLIDINLPKSTFIITDESDIKGGKVANNYNENARAYGVYLTAGTFKLLNGAISSTNPHTYSSATANKNSAASAVYITAGQIFTMENGTVESASQYASYAIHMARGTSTVTINNGLVKGRTTKSTTAVGIYNLGKGLTVNGGRIVGHAYTTTAYGIYLYGGHGTINGGTIEATNDTTSNKGSTTTYGIYVNYYNGTYKGVLTIPSTSTVNVFAKARTTTAAAVMVGGSSTGSTIAGGIFTAKTKTSSTAYGVYSSGNITVSGGTFNVNSYTTTAYGIYSLRGKVTVNGNPTFNVTSGTTTAYGAFAYGTIGKKGTGKYSGTIEINGGTFNITSTKETAYGAYAGLYSRNITQKGTVANDTIFGQHYMPGILIVNDGVFNVKATTTGAYGIVVSAAKNESGDVGTTERIPLGTVTGGNFKVESMGDANATAYAMNTATTAARMIVEGGWYNTDKTNASSNPTIGGKYTAPTKDCNYWVLDLPEEELPYKYEVAEAYQITFNNEDGTQLQKSAQRKGATPIYSGAEPTKEQDASYTYTFDTWSPALASVTAAATYTATYTSIPRTYNITLNTDGGTINAGNVETYTVGTGATLPTNVTKEGFNFGGWFDNDGLTGDAVTTISTSATGDKTFWAKWTVSETGFYADIVDVDNAAKTLTLNVTGWASNGWPYNVNGVPYGKNKDAGQAKWREDDRTLILSYGDKTPGEDFSITIKKTGGDVVSMHSYIIPTEIKSDANLGDQQMLYVKAGATLTVNANKTVKNIYVAPGAKLVVNSGVTLEADTVFLRTTPWESAELELNGTITGKVCYTRIISKKDQYYQFGLPMPCPIESVTLSDGSKPVYGNGWLLRSYSEYNRAMNGTSAEADNWVTLTNVGDDNTIQGRVGYEMFSNSGYYREYYFPVAHTGLATSVSVTRTTEGKDGKSTKGADHEGWNIICSPLMSAATIEPVPEGMKVSWLQADGSYWQRSVTEIKPAIPFSYQATANGSISFAQSIAAPALRRVAATEEPVRIQWMQLDILNAAGLCDQTEIYSHPARYEQRYQTGIDVAKQSFSASRALIYSSHVYGDMAFAGVADSLLERGVALTVYCPSAQELTISMRENDWLDRMAQVWLVDHETGARTDLLASDYTFDAAAGTTAGRFTIEGVFRAPQVTTDVDNGQWTMDNGQGTKAKKLILRDKMYILVGDTLYDATGRLVK